MSRGPLSLAIDAGTTGVRAILFDVTAQVRGGAYREVSLAYPRPGWVEVDPEALWRAVRGVIAAALRAAGATAGDVAAIGIANQRGTAILWDRQSGQPLYPGIVWQDARTADRVAELQAGGIFASVMASATKLEWMLRQLPGAPARAERGELCFGTVDTWLAAKLSGGRLHVTDHSNASCTGMYDYAAGAWDEGTLVALDIAPSLLPQIVSSCGMHGEADLEASGLVAPISALVGDQQASMFGLQRQQPGDFKVTFGTSAMVDVNTGEMPVLSAHGAYPLVLWQIAGLGRLFCLEGTAITAGAAVQWLRDGLGIVGAAAETSALATQVPDAGGVWVVPAFQGLGTPYLDPATRALVGGLSRASTRAHLVRATLEGIAFRTREVIEALCADLGVGLPSVLRADGGAAENDFLLQQLADVLGVPVERPPTTQGTALGAALLAGLGAGVWTELAEISQLWRSQRCFEPRSDEALRTEAFETWKRRLALARSDCAAS